MSPFVETHKVKKFNYYIAKTEYNFGLYVTKIA